MRDLYKVRHATELDLPLLNIWMAHWNIEPIAQEIYPVDSTFVLEKEDKPYLVVSCYRVEKPKITYMEGIMRSPFSPPDREAIKVLQEHIDVVEKARGTRRLVALTDRADLNKLYTSLGYNNRTQGLFLSVKELF